MSPHRHEEEGTHGGHHHIHEFRDIRPLRIALLLTGLVLAVQLVGGLLTNSVVLASYAAHVFVDVSSLLIAYIGLTLGARMQSRRGTRFTFGLRRLEILAALTNGFVLIGICVFIVLEAIGRLSHPMHVHADEMLWVAITAFVANSFSAWYLHKSTHITTRSAYLHVVTDLMSSIGVVIAAIAVKLTNWPLIDSAIGIAIAVVISVGAIRIIREALIILMETAPYRLSIADLEAGVRSIPGILDVHDIHVWQLSRKESAATLHVVTQQPNDEMLRAVQQFLHDHFGIHHVTVQIEQSNLNDEC
ncbi:MAG: cation transporter [Flavobacteriales bacterium]|nr:MAG: Co/Zn/Cd efflux system protein [Chlorobi bacterium OLB6]MBE2265262.1 cation transporter [Flavobacteriales bacterium]MBW7853413.1 cation transporter [Candidatus Kapabacteria bacterium]QOJ26498.1 MAG: cation transporter [Ignavibacteria bacterium]WKZ76743.1 MAG: cation diffusion facilitator family transporter [Candidatus Kapabacteria bacterium]